ncbi:unnamed protein product [Strongylus vulgaris]|uniref:Uncharacterized protein n=1 Tax=Strongylus vulgaris TaxID=40348 RepID=A0A3P7JN71_STRVU|nr:unnamed protein product [Strongylus vulgaris]
MTNVLRRNINYYQQCTAIRLADPLRGPVILITAEEVWLAVTRTKYGKASGPDDIPKRKWKKMRVPYGLQASSIRSSKLSPVIGQRAQRFRYGKMKAISQIVQRIGQSG